MKTITTNLLFFIIIAFSISSCSKDEDEVVPDESPQAIILSTAIAAPLDTVFLDGSASKNAENFEWTSSSSMGSSVTFYSNQHSQTNNDSKVYFIAENVGVYTINLRVTKGGEFNVTSKSISVSGAVQIGGTLTSQMELSNLNVLNSDSCDYFLTEDLIIPVGMSLTIKDGVKICVAEGVSIISEGFLTIDGGVGVKIEALGNNWKGIHLKRGGAEIKGLTVEGAGSSSFTNDPSEKAGLYIETPNVQELTNSNFIDNDGYGVIMNKGVIINRYFATYSNNTSGPAILSLEVHTANQSGTQLSNVLPNTYLGLRGGSAGSVSLLNKGIPYLLYDDMSFTALQLLAGTEIYVKDTVGIFIDQNFISQGNSSDPIIIEGVTQAAGSWKGIQCNIASLKYTTIQYAGSAPLKKGSFSQTFEYNCGLMVNYNSCTLENSTISNNNGYGVALYQLTNNPNSYKYVNNDISNNSTGAVLVNAFNVSTITSDLLSSYSGYGSKPIITIHGENSATLAMNTNPTNWRKLSAAVSSTDYKLLDGDYVVTQNGVLTIDQGVFIECDANVKIEITSGSTLDAQGINSEKIVFRGSTGTPGFWDGIYANTNSTLILDYVNIDHGGSGNGAYQGCLTVSSNVSTTSSTVTNCAFLNGSVFDLFFNGVTDVLGIKDIANNNTFVNSN